MSKGLCGERECVSLGLGVDFAGCGGDFGRWGRCRVLCREGI